MCIKLRRPLNPQAPEWRPSTLQPPPPLVPPPQQQLVQLLPFTSGPPQNLLSQFPCRHPCYPSFVPFHCVSFPADQSLYEAAEKDLGCGNEINLQEENTDESCDKAKVVEMAPKRASVNVVKKGVRMALPPRLQRALRSTFGVDKKPWVVKKEWRPRKSVNPESYEGSGDAGASLSTLPASGDDFSHPSKTTVMIKNIPNQLGRDFMLKFLDDSCKSYSLEYDFLYLPMDFRKKGNLGYAFVNFTSAVAALEFSKNLHNYKWETACSDRGPITSKKICEVTWARIQGKEALIRRFKNSSFCCDRLDFLPVVLDPPRNGSDPNPCAPVVLGKLSRQEAIRSKTY